MDGGPECMRTIIKANLNIEIFIVDNIIKDVFLKKKKLWLKMILLALCIKEILFFEDFGS